jgi:hypothetical protein
MKAAKWGHLEALDLSCRPIVEEREAKDVLLGLGDVKSLASWHWSRKPHTNFQLKVEL